MTDEKATPRGAVLQFEIDRKRWSGKPFPGDTTNGVLERLVAGTAMDTLRKGGTFVLVVTDDKLTMVQRPDAEELDP